MNLPALLLVPATLCSFVPTLDSLSSNWVDPTEPVSKAAELGAEQRDLATIQNFWGAVGIAPEGTRPVDMFAVNSLEMPPFAGCGSGPGVPFGCGLLMVDGAHVEATATRWSVNEAMRRSKPLPGSGVVVQVATRMPFEQNGVMWELNFTNPTNASKTIRVDLSLTGAVSELPTVGTWVYPATSQLAGRSMIAVSGMQKGAVSCGGGSHDLQVGSAVAERSACLRYVFVGRQPDAVAPLAPPPPPPAPLPPFCTIAGMWVQATSGETFGPFVEDNATHTFGWRRGEADPHSERDGWFQINGTVTTGNKISLLYSHTKARGGKPTAERGAFDGDCDHVIMSDSPWHRPGSGPPAPAPVPVQPNATFHSLTLGSGQTVTIQVAMSVGANLTDVEDVGNRFAADPGTFATAWTEAYSKWQTRWQQAFTPSNGFWSGNLPTLQLAESSSAANVTRLYYMSILTVVSQMRTNLPLVFERVWPNGNGNVGHTTMGIGGSRLWWWDEALTSMMLALLEPEGRAPTFQAWLAHDDHPGTKFGHGKGNGYALDCEPLGSTSCGFAGEQSPQQMPSGATPGEGPEYGFYCYNPWAFYMAMSNHLRLNNDTAFLRSKAASSNLTVEEALEGIATDFQEYLIAGTNLVDYGPAMDCFSPTCESSQHPRTLHNP